MEPDESLCVEPTPEDEDMEEEEAQEEEEEEDEEEQASEDDKRKSKSSGRFGGRSTSGRPRRATAGKSNFNYINKTKNICHKLCFLLFRNVCIC